MTYNPWNGKRRSAAPATSVFLRVIVREPLVHCKARPLILPMETTRRKLIGAFSMPAVSSVSMTSIVRAIGSPVSARREQYRGYDAIPAQISRVPICSATNAENADGRVSLSASTRQMHLEQKGSALRHRTFMPTVGGMPL